MNCSNQEEALHPALHKEVHPQSSLPGKGWLLAITVVGIGAFCAGFWSDKPVTRLTVHVVKQILPQNDDTIQPDSIQDVQQGEAPQVEGIEASAVPQQPQPAFAEAHLVIQSDKESYLVLDNNTKPDWGQGKAQTTNNDGFMFTTTRAVPMPPKEFAQYTGRDFVLYDGRGYVCTARVESFHLIRQVAADGIEYAFGEEDPFAYGGASLVAQLKTLRGTCTKALWARDAQLASPSVARVVKAGKKLHRRAFKAFLASDAYKEIQAQLAEDFPDDERWQPTHESFYTTFVKSPEEQLVIITSYSGGCGMLGANIGLVFRRNADGSLVQIDTDESLILDVKAAADIDGDGDLDLITGGEGFDTALLRQNEEFNVETYNAVPIHYCQC
jgi:hypothetical protein